MRKSVLLTVVALVGLTGCLGLLGGDETPNPEELRGSSENATESLSTYAFEAEATVEATLAQGNATDDPPGITLFFNGNGAVNTTERRMRLESTSTTRMGTGTRETTSEIRLVDGSMYVDSGDGWRRANVTDFDDVWDAHDVAGAATKALKANLSLADTETVTVGGDEAYAVEAVSHDEEYARSVLERTRLYLQTAPEGGARLTNAEVVESSATVWIDAEDRHPLRTQAETVFDATLETEAGETETRLSVETSSDIYDHGEAVKIETPDTDDGSGILPFGG